MPRYSVQLEEQGLLEAYCLLRSHEIMLKMEDQYDFVKFMIKMQELKESFEQIGILNLIPVGSTVNKIVRRDNFMVDIILNYSKTTLFKAGEDTAIFDALVEKIRSLLEGEFTGTGYFISSSGLYRETP